MRAVWYEQIGPAQKVLQVGEMPTPEPGAGEVRIRVQVAGINPGDSKRREGAMGTKMPFPRIIPGDDGAGIIEKVGMGVPTSRLGERVWTYFAQWNRPFGTAAEYVVVPENQAIYLPDSVDIVEGASLGVPTLTAHHCVFAGGDVRGKTVLVQGGAGMVGNSAVQLAKWAGATVITTVSSAEQEKLAHDTGADFVINRKTENVVEQVKTISEIGVDTLVEVAFGPNIGMDQAILKPNGIISVYEAGGQAEPVLPLFPLLFNCITLRLVFVYNIPEQVRQAALADITTCLQANKLQHVVARQFSLDDVVAAYEAVEHEHLNGRVTLRISE